MHKRLCSFDEFVGYAAAISPVLSGGEPEFPTRYWVAVRLTQDGEQYAGVTEGLSPFTVYEINLNPIPWPIDDFAGRLIEVVQYLFSVGPILKDSEILGVSKTEHFRIREEAGQLHLTL